MHNCNSGFGAQFCFSVLVMASLILTPDMEEITVVGPKWSESMEWQSEPERHHQFFRCSSHPFGGSNSEFALQPLEPLDG
jgi:hypothetical protein